MNTELLNKIDAFVEKNLPNIIADAKTLLNIKSVKEPPVGDAPFGEGVYKALHAALALAQREGMTVESLDNRIGIAHYGDTEKFIGMMAHMDVVPEGEGWESDPFNCIEREGCLVARGAEDNKTPFVMNLYAIKFLIENKIPLKYGIRLLAGCDEETGMSDIKYYLERRPAPLFTYIPDSVFPVGVGEKGIFEADLYSEFPLSDSIKVLHGGVASNVIPDRAHAVVNAKLNEVKPCEGFVITGTDGNVNIEAQGISAHASRPAGSRNAIIMLLNYLISSELITDSDKKILSFVTSHLDVDFGEHFGIASDDGIFTPLTCIGGVIDKTDDGVVRQNINIRYPTTITGATIIQKISEKCANNAWRFALKSDHEPHLIAADGNGVNALMSVYKTITGKDEKPYVMSGGTYARLIPGAVTFGAEFEGEQKPAFAGTVHGKNEAVTIETIRKATKIYTAALVELQNTEL